jgi:hypothetical protein
MKINIKLDLLLVTIVIGCSLHTVGAAPPKKEPPVKVAEPIPFPDGVLDADGRTAFVSSPKGGIQAIRLDDGKVIWTNDACPAQPWLVAGSRLIARGDRLFILDLKNDGKLLRQCDAVGYPKVAVPDRCTVAFHLWNPHVAGDTLEAQWYGVANIDRSKGRPFNFKDWTAFNKTAPVGSTKINLDTGKAAIQTDPMPADVTAGLVPEAAKPEQRMPAGLPKELEAVWRQYHKDQNGCITVLGDRMVGVSMTLEKMGNEYSKKVALNSWDIKTGKAAASVELVKDKAINIANVALTGDRQHAGIVFGTSALRIFSLSDAKVVGIDVKGVQSPERAFVAGKRLYYSHVSGFGKADSLNFLTALDLENGKSVWVNNLKPRSTIPLPP